MIVISDKVIIDSFFIKLLPQGSNIFKCLLTKQNATLFKMPSPPLDWDNECKKIDIENHQFY